MEVQSENKTFSHNGSTYRLKQLNLGILNKAAPLLLKFRKLQYEYTKDIDDSELRYAQNEISEIRTAISQLDESNCSELAEISRLSEKLKCAEHELKHNNRLQSQQELLNDAESLALFELLTDEEIINPFLRNVLEPASAQGNEINVDGVDSLEFIKEVVTDFFALTLRSKERFQN